MNTGMSFLQMATTASTFITGGFGTTLTIMAVALCGLKVMYQNAHGGHGHYWPVITGGSMFYGAAWAVSYFWGGGAGGGGVLPA